MPFPHALIIPTAWSTPFHSSRLLRVFSSVRVPSSTLSLPSANNATARNPLALDVAAIRAELTRLVIDQGLEVFVIAHGYGGVVATEAVEARFGQAARRAEENEGGVVHVVYMCAVMPGVGETLGGCFEMGLPDVDVDERGLCRPTNPREVLFEEIDDEPETQSRAVKELVGFPVRALQERVTRAAWREHSTSYMFCTEDRVVPYQMQVEMVEKRERDLGRQLELSKLCNAGHSPMLGQPETVLELYWEFVLDDRDGLLL